MSEDEDKATVVLDISTLKSQLEENEDIISQDESLNNLQFGASEESLDESLEEQINEDISTEPQKNVYFFQYKTSYFSDNDSFFKQAINFEVLSDIKELNAVLTNDPSSIIVFYYNSLPKAINQLSMQIKTKFTNTSTIIIAKNLSASKAQQHHESKYGADSYLNDPFTVEDLEKTVSKLCNS